MIVIKWFYVFGIIGNYGREIGGYFYAVYSLVEMVYIE